MIVAFFLLVSDLGADLPRADFFRGPICRGPTFLGGRFAEGRFGKGPIRPAPLEILFIRGSFSVKVSSHGLCP